MIAHEGKIVSWTDMDPFVVNFSNGGELHFYKDGRTVGKLSNPDEAAYEFIKFVEQHYRTHILEAEQRGYERARAECAADTRRLEWLEKTRSVVLEDADNGWRVTIGGIEFSMMEETAREAIAVAMEGEK